MKTNTRRELEFNIFLSSKASQTSTRMTEYFFKGMEEEEVMKTWKSLTERERFDT